MVRKIFLALFLLSLATVAFAFSLTPALKQEIADKKAALAANPQDFRTRFDLAITYAYSNKVEDGWGELKKLVEQEKDYKTIAQQLVVEYTNKLIADPDDWKSRFRLAFALYFNGNHKRAIEEFNNIIEQDPKNVWPYGYAAIIYGEENDFDSTIDYLKRAISIDSNVAVLHFALGQAYYKKNNGFGGFAETMEALRLRALGF